ncbi:hypothetical protein [Streptomyces sp. SID13726]|uniref:hypothetical protein n=1 Tax=Streptomyces sp. SID13726 TaxID=2706058 RepID=UPI0013B86DEB|nr:hypothetical protein [Streptomyces sp. SID13726]NEB03544.1 hypothetical protein [Streptomyces sp. SID13726]
MGVGLRGIRPTELELEYLLRFPPGGSFDLPPFRPTSTAGRATWPEAIARFGPSLHSFTDQAEDVARRVAHVTGHEPVVLDLSEATAPIHALQVICPGARSRIRRTMPR